MSALGLSEILPWAGTCWYWAAPRLVLRPLSSSALSSWSSIINTGTITIQLIWISRELKYNLTWSILMINKIWGVQSQLQAYHRFVVPIPDFHFSLPCNFFFLFCSITLQQSGSNLGDIRGDRRDRRQHWCQEFIAVILISDQKSGNQEFGSNAQLLGHVAIFISLDGEDSWERVVINFYCRVGTRHLIINNLFSVAATKSVEF